MTSHSTGATIASEKFSARLSIAARATPASSSAGGIAADDMRYRGAAGGEAAVFRARRRHRRRAGAGSLRDQGAGQERRPREIRTAGATARAAATKAIAPTIAEQDQQRDDAGARRAVWPRGFAVEQAVERIDQPRRSRSPDGRSRASAVADNRDRARSAWRRVRARPT